MTGVLDERWTPRPHVVSALHAKLVALRDDDPDMPDLDVREVALEPDAAVLRVLFTHGRHPGRMLGIRFNADLRGFPPPPGLTGREAHEDEWLSLLPHLFIEEFWTHRFCRITDDVTWFETFPPEGPGPYSGWPT